MFECFKVIHLTKKKAEIAAKVILRQGRNKKSAKLRAYYCPIHKAWHLTSMKKGEYELKLKK